MMIVITQKDFSKLSTQCRRELSELFTSCFAQTEHDESNMTEVGSYIQGDHDEFAAGLFESGCEVLDVPLVDAPRKTARKLQKTVAEVDVDQARLLVKNVSHRSKRALEWFVSGEWVSISDLVGPDKAYHNLVELKKSLIAGINRRLRTVTQNRTNVLFSSTPDRSAIRITQKSADSLRQVLVPVRSPDFSDQDSPS